MDDSPQLDAPSSEPTLLPRFHLLGLMSATAIVAVFCGGWFAMPRSEGTALILVLALAGFPIAVAGSCSFDGYGRAACIGATLPLLWLWVPLLFSPDAVTQVMGIGPIGEPAGNPNVPPPGYDPFPAVTDLRRWCLASIIMAVTMASVACGAHAACQPARTFAWTTVRAICIILWIMVVVIGFLPDQVLHWHYATLAWLAAALAITPCAAIAVFHTQDVWRTASIAALCAGLLQWLAAAGRWDIVTDLIWLQWLYHDNQAWLVPIDSAQTVGVVAHEMNFRLLSLLTIVLALASGAGGTLAYWVQRPGTKT